MAAAMVPAMPAAALRHLTAIWKPGFKEHKETMKNSMSHKSMEEQHEAVGFYS